MSVNWTLVARNTVFEMAQEDESISDPAKFIQGQLGLRAIAETRREVKARAKKDVSRKFNAMVAGQLELLDEQTFVPPKNADGTFVENEDADSHYVETSRIDYHQCKARAEYLAFKISQASRELQSWNNILRTYGKVWATVPDTALEDLAEKIEEDAA